MSIMVDPLVAAGEEVIELAFFVGATILSAIPKRIRTANATLDMLDIQYGIVEADGEIDDQPLAPGDDAIVPALANIILGMTPEQKDEDKTNLTPAYLMADGENDKSPFDMGFSGEDLYPMLVGILAKMAMTGDRDVFMDSYFPGFTLAVTPGPPINMHAELREARKAAEDGDDEDMLHAFMARFLDDPHTCALTAAQTKALRAHAVHWYQARLRSIQLGKKATTPSLITLVAIVETTIGPHVTTSWGIQDQVTGGGERIRHPDNVKVPGFVEYVLGEGYYFTLKGIVSGYFASIEGDLDDYLGGQEAVGKAEANALMEGAFHNLNFFAGLNDAGEPLVGISQEFSNYVANNAIMQYILIDQWDLMPIHSFLDITRFYLATYGQTPVEINRAVPAAGTGDE